MKLVALSVVTVALVLAAKGIEAHHSVATFFDLQKTVEVKGVVEDYRLMNPHMRMVLQVTAADGTKEKWVVTGGVTGDLRAAGWTPESVKIGDVVTISGPPARSAAAKGMYVRKLVKADGTTLEQRVRD